MKIALESIMESSYNEKSFTRKKIELINLFSKEQLKESDNNIYTSFEETYFYREMGKIFFAKKGLKIKENK